MRLNLRTLSAGSNIQFPHSLSTLESSTPRDSEPVSDQLDRLNSILSNMMKEINDIPLPQTDSTTTHHKRIIPFIAPLKLQNLSANQSEPEEDSINGFSCPISINYTEEDRLIEIDFESRLEQEFLSQCRNVMILEDFRSHELRNFYRLQDDDFSLENLELKNDSFDSPVSFKHSEEIEVSLLGHLANDLSQKLGINIPNRNTLEFTNSIEELFTKEIKISLKELSELEVQIHRIIDLVENGAEVRRELKMGPFKITLHINEVYGNHLLTNKRRIGKRLSTNEVYKSVNENSLAESDGEENYINQLENELSELRLELSLKPDADVLTQEMQATMQNAYEEDLKFGDIDTRSTDLRLISFSSNGSSRESKFSNSLELEFKTLKSKKDEIDKLKVGVEWQLQELIFFKKEFEQREVNLKQKEDLLEREHANIRVKEREMIQQQDLLFKLRKEFENIKFKINYERMQLDKDKNEHHKRKINYDKVQSLKSIEALNLKEHIQRLLYNKQELSKQVSSVVNLLNEKEQSKMEGYNIMNSRGRKTQQNTPTNKARFCSGSPSRLSTEIMASMSLAELQNMKSQLENEMRDPSINETSKTRLEIHISRISTQLADLRYKKTIDIMQDTDKEAAIIHKMINNLKKIQLPTEELHKRAQTHSACSTPLVSKPRKPHSFTHTAVDDFSDYITSPKPAPLSKETSVLPPNPPKDNPPLPPKTPRELNKPPTGRSNLKSPIKLTPLNLNRLPDSELSTDNSSAREDVMCDKELILIEKENILNREQVKLKGKEEELKNLEKMLDNEKAVICQERYDLLKKEKEWQSTWNKLPDADELIPIIQQGHLQVMRELDAFERKKKVLEKDKIEISKYWKQVAETKKLIAAQMKEITQTKKENIRERKTLEKMRKDFATLLPALQSMIRLAQ